MPTNICHNRCMEKLFMITIFSVYSTHKFIIRQTKAIRPPNEILGVIGLNV